MKYIEVSGNGLAVRRRDKRVWYVLLGVFVAVFLFSFMVQRFKNDGEATAASLAGFDPGYIISDYQMGNYTSMDEAQIQSFLTNKNSCSNRDYNLYLQLSANKNYTWHWKDGHFVCLSEELFGDGEVIGSGETAAHIIWQAAQDYGINPQALIVLLQKETSLITDPIPNSGDYRKATGYGCPDTAPCSAQYYGFKNQVRKAAELFSTVLNGGWTNYPLGNNYIQYNPNAGCGGSIVNIRSLATSALYRYTPYQPNAGAIAAGYGTAYCGAYGNRNFYLYFEDWFGGITNSGLNWYNMETPRYMVTKTDSAYYNPILSDYTEEAIGAGVTMYYSKKTITKDGKMCLKSQDDEINNFDRCVIYDELAEKEWLWGEMETPRYMERGDKSKLIDLDTMKVVGIPKQFEFYDSRVGLPNNDMCLRIRGNEDNKCVLYSSLNEAKVEVVGLIAPRFMTSQGKTANIIDPITEKVVGQIDDDEKIYFTKKTITPGDELCLLIENGVSNNACVRFSDLSDVWVEMERPRVMRMNTNSYKVNGKTLKINYVIALPTGMMRKFVMKKYMPDGEWCLQTEYDFERETDDCIRYKELSEI